MLYLISSFICIAYYLYVGFKCQSTMFSYQIMKNNRDFNHQTKIFLLTIEWKSFTAYPLNTLHWWQRLSEQNATRRLKKNQGQAQPTEFHQASIDDPKTRTHFFYLFKHQDSSLVNQPARINP